MRLLAARITTILLPTQRMVFDLVNKEITCLILKSHDAKVNQREMFGWEWSPSTDSGTVKPVKYSFALARKRVESGGWTRQVTARELPVSKAMAGVEMRLTAGGVRYSYAGVHSSAPN
jgi:hypothetical protein